MTHLKLCAGFSNLVHVGQRASVIRRPRLRQAELLDLLKLHLPVKRKAASVRVYDASLLHPQSNHNAPTHTQILVDVCSLAQVDTHHTQ